MDWLSRNALSLLADRGGISISESVPALQALCLLSSDPDKPRAITITSESTKEVFSDLISQGFAYQEDNYYGATGKAFSWQHKQSLKYLVTDL